MAKDAKREMIFAGRLLRLSFQMLGFSPFSFLSRLSSVLLGAVHRDHTLLSKISAKHWTTRSAQRALSLAGQRHFGEPFGR